MTSLLAALAGKPIAWHELGLTRDELRAVCDREELHGLLFTRLSASPVRGTWAPEIFEELTRRARDETAREMVRREEIAGVLSTLAAAGAHAIIIKGTALAYTVYDTPIQRPRLDTDLIVGPGDAAAARNALTALGYDAAPYCDELLSQFHMERTDAFGVRHVFDIHTRISTQPVFADLVTYAEMAARAVPAPPLGPDAVTAGGIHALLLACVHPVMHHQNAERLVWAYDVHLLASSLGIRELGEFTRLAVERRVGSVCARSLRLAQTAFQTPVPPDVMDALSRAGAREPSAAYLASQRRWHHEFVSSVRALPGLRDRLRLVREVLLPRPAYMLGAYGLERRPMALWLLPALYVHRNVRGAWRILRRQK